MDVSVVFRWDLAELTNWSDAEECTEHFVAYYKDTFGHAKNYFLACNRSGLLIKLWHNKWLEYWTTRKGEHANSYFLGNIRDDPFFAGVYMKHHLDSQSAVTGYFAQHVCFDMLMQQDERFKAVAHQNVRNMLPATSTSGALWLYRHFQRSAWLRLQKDVEEISQRLLKTCDPKDGESVFQNVFSEELLSEIDCGLFKTAAFEQMALAKFPGLAGQILERSCESLLRQPSNMQRLFLNILDDCDERVLGDAEVLCDIVKTEFADLTLVRDAAPELPVG